MISSMYWSFNIYYNTYRLDIHFQTQSQSWIIILSSVSETSVYSPFFPPKLYQMFQD